MKVFMLIIGAFISPFLAGVLVGFGLAVRWYGKASSGGARASNGGLVQSGAAGGEIVDPEAFPENWTPKEREQWGRRKFCARRAG